MNRVLRNLAMTTRLETSERNFESYYDWMTITDKTDSCTSLLKRDRAHSELWYLDDLDGTFHLM